VRGWKGKKIAKYNGEKGGGGNRSRGYKSGGKELEGGGNQNGANARKKKIRPSWGMREGIWAAEPVKKGGKAERKNKWGGGPFLKKDGG